MFHKDGAEKVDELDTLLTTADKVNKSAPRDMNTLNLFLTHEPLYGDDLERILRLKYPDFDNLEMKKQQNIRQGIKSVSALKKPSETRFRYIYESVRQVLMAKTKIQELDDDTHPLYGFFETKVDFAFCEALNEFCEPVVQMIDHFESNEKSTLTDILPAYEFMLCVCADLNKADRSEKGEYLRALKKSLVKSISEQVFNQVSIIFFLI